MSVAEHRSTSPRAVSCYVLTVSDTRTPETDTSGRAIVELLLEAGHAVAGRSMVPDDPPQVARTVREALAAAETRVVICTGGTGFTRRDSTVEAVSALFDRPMPGFGEIFRLLSFEQIGPAAMLSRATAGAIGDRAVFLLPGSEQAVRLAMSRLIVPELGHLARELAR